ncbi:hypothetical protein ABTZ78_02995 [Streptomyces bauhiniae]|uniref:tetratricopeptide repeat protein n=1 Tax=Streptomyces bauhiniae TaxID=2340725 RepID=UPI00332A8843
MRSLIGRAARNGGFVLLVGGSSVGKTRSLHEAIHALLPDWWLLHPADAGHIEHIARLAPRRLVIWLDELQNYLSGTHQLSVATVRALLEPPHQVVIVGTLWPHYFDLWTAPPTPKQDDDRFRGERELLKLADVVHVGAAFSPAERERAATLSATDQRLRLALASEDFGLTQVIAGAPQLVHRWENAGPYARALMTAAVNATLLGVQSPVPGELLRSAVPGYCAPAERAGAPTDWFEEALSYATRPLLGATAALIPVSDGVAIGRPDGYRVADYLLQHTGRSHQAVPPPETFWEACAEHLTDSDDLARTGSAAAARQRLGAAVPLLRRAAEAGVVSAMQELGELYRRMGDAAGAEEMADLLTTSTDPHADLYRVILAGWDFEELFDLAEAGNQYAVSHLIEYGDPRLAISLLLERTGPDDLGNWRRLAELLHDEGEDEQAIEILEMILRRQDDPDDDLLLFLTELLRHANRVERLWELTDEGYFWAAHFLADLLHDRGDKEEALDVLREFAGLGSMDVDDLLARFLAEGGHLDELLTRAETGDCRSAVEGALMLRDRGETEQAVALLNPFAKDGEVYAASTLASLQECGESMDELRERAATGDRHAAGALVRMLLAAGRRQEAVEVALGYGTYLDREIVDDLEQHGEVDLVLHFLRARADSGESYYTHQLAKSLSKHCREDELRERVDRGDPGALTELCELLRNRGADSEAEALMRHGLTADGHIAEPG